jgi:hypothetical protein
MTDFKSSDRDVSRAIRSWLHEDRHEDASRVAGAVLDHVEATPRRRAGWPAWRTPTMNRFLTFGLGAAAVVVLAVIVGAQLLRSPTGDVGSGATPSPEPTVAASPTSTPAAGIPEGPFALSDGSVGTGGVPATVTIPAPGWYGETNSGVLCKGEDECADPPDGAGMIGPWFGELYVFGDPCEWSTTKPDKPATTVDEVVAALTNQASRNASAPVGVTLGGYEGKFITLHVPDDADFGTCDQGYFGSWALPDDPTPSRYHQGPGQVDELWIVDMNGVLTIMDASYYGQTPADDVDELHAIVESMTFE